MNPLIDGCGVYKHLEEGTYRSLPYFSASGIRACRDNGSTWKLHQTLQPSKGGTTSAMSFGTDFHSFVLEPQAFTKEYGIIPAGQALNRNPGRALKADILKEGLRPIKQEDLDAIRAMNVAMMKHRWMREHFDIAKADVELCVVNEVEGFRIKSRIDAYFPDVDGGTIIDLKTTQDATKREWRYKQIPSYKLQAAVYINQLRLQGLPVKNFFFVPVEKDPPHLTAMYGLEEADIQADWEWVKDLLRRYKHDQANGWPHINDEPVKFTYVKEEARL